MLVLPSDSDDKYPKIKKQKRRCRKKRETCLSTTQAAQVPTRNAAERAVPAQITPCVADRRGAPAEPSPDPTLAWQHSPPVGTQGQQRQPEPSAPTATPGAATTTAPVNLNRVLEELYDSGEEPQQQRAPQQHREAAA